jgi:hypothetical protein
MLNGRDLRCFGANNSERTAKEFFLSLLLAFSGLKTRTLFLQNQYGTGTFAVLPITAKDFVGTAKTSPGTAKEQRKPIRLIIRR